MADTWEVLLAALTLLYMGVKIKSIMLIIIATSFCIYCIVIIIRASLTLVAPTNVIERVLGM